MKRLFDLVLALGGAGSYLSDAEFEGLRAHAAGPMVVSVFGEGHLPAVGDLDEVTLSRATERLSEFASSAGGTMLTIFGMPLHAAYASSAGRGAIALRQDQLLGISPNRSDGRSQQRSSEFFLFSFFFFFGSLLCPNLLNI